MARNRYPKMTALARTFPTFDPEHGNKADAPGIEPFDADRLVVSMSGWSHGELCAAKFLLEVFHPGADWLPGRFDLMEALSVWDDAHRRAFIAWAEMPWWL